MTDSASTNMTRASLQLLFFWLVATGLTSAPLALFLTPMLALGVGAAVGVIATMLTFRLAVDMVLGVHEAEIAPESNYSRYHNVVEGLCVGAGVQKPELYVVRSTAMNIFSAGRSHKHAVICATDGLLRKLDRIELEAVVAHELAHIRSLDIVPNTVGAVTAGFVPLMADLTDRSVQKGRWVVWPLAVLFALLKLGARLFAVLLRFAIPKGRESAADLRGVAITRYPPGLAAALEKLSESSTVVDVGSNATAHLWISTPLINELGDLAKSQLFDVHPPLEERIALLREL